MSDLPEASQVVEIKLDCKYIIEVPASADEDGFRAFIDHLNEWWASNEPIFIIGSGLTLKRVEDKPLVSQAKPL